MKTKLIEWKSNIVSLKSLAVCVCKYVIEYGFFNMEQRYNYDWNYTKIN